MDGSGLYIRLRHSDAAFAASTCEGYDAGLKSPCGKRGNERRPLWFRPAGGIEVTASSRIARSSPGEKRLIESTVRGRDPLCPLELDPAESRPHHLPLRIAAGEDQQDGRGERLRVWLDDGRRPLRQ